MTAAEALLARRSDLRLDPDRPVPDSLLVRLLDLASRAHSPHHLQPWRFLVIRERSNRDKLRRLAFNHPRLDEAPVALLVLGFLHPDRSHWTEILSRMTATLALSPETAHRIDAEARRDLAAEPDRSCWACRWATAASTSLMLASRSLGLAACPIDRFEQVPIRDAFGIPLDHALCGLLALGFPAENSPALDRLPLGELCFEEHFGQPWTLGEGDGDQDTADTDPGHPFHP